MARILLILLVLGLVYFRCQAGGPYRGVKPEAHERSQGVEIDAGQVHTAFRKGEALGGKFMVFGVTDLRKQHEIYSFTSMSMAMAPKATYDMLMKEFPDFQECQKRIAPSVREYVLLADSPESYEAIQQVAKQYRKGKPLVIELRGWLAEPLEVVYQSEQRTLQTEMSFILIDEIHRLLS